MKYRIYEYDGKYNVHPDDKSICEIGHDCGEPCICEVGRLIGEFEQTIRVSELMRALKIESDDHIVGHFHETSAYTFYLALPGEKVNLQFINYFDRDLPAFTFLDNRRLPRAAKDGGAL